MATGSFMTHNYSSSQNMIPSNCDSLCADNEYFVAQVNPCNTCDSRGQCTVLDEQKPGCDCKTGHYRNREGVCVPEEECQGEINLITFTPSSYSN
ncbi:hypothetical protein TNCV_1466971 [Trichonephila clavipes]|nr:hypothetical protein TNCV_1466971 [Trichonephila clavipes]